MFWEPMFDMSGSISLFGKRQREQSERISPIAAFFALSPQYERPGMLKTSSFFISLYETVIPAKARSARKFSTVPSTRPPSVRSTNCGAECLSL